MKKSYQNIHVTLMGGDNRMRCLAKILADSGYNVRDIDEAPYQLDLNCDYLVLPLPVTQDGLHLNCQWDGKPDLVDIISNTPKSTKILAGCISERVEDMLQQRGIGWVDYYAQESLLQQNAYLTAEATLQLVLQNLNYSIKDASVLVIGGGRCGTQTAKLFKKVGSKVTLTSRKLKDKIRTLFMGVKPEKTANLCDVVGKHQVIINTVPHPILTREVLQNVENPTLVIELASSAAGVDVKAAQTLGTNLLYAPGLPGRYLPESAAKAMANTIIKIIKEDSM